MRLNRVPVWARWGLGVIGLIAALILALSLLDWNMLRGPVGRAVSATTGRSVQIHGDLKVKLLSWTPGATADDVEIGGAPGVAKGDLAHIGRFSIKVDLPSLLIGRVRLPLMAFEQPQIWAFRDTAGRTNWQSGASNPRPLKLPPIQHFVIDNGQFQLIDQKRGLTLRARLQSSETLLGAGRGSFQLQGSGAVNLEPFSLNLTGGPLLEVRTDKPYHFIAHLRSGQTRIAADGVLPHPFDLSRVSARFTVSGADLANLYYLNGVALPTTPPYRLSGDLVRNGQIWTVTQMNGKVGDSDLEGQFQVDHSDPRPRLTATLRSRSLDLKDLAAVTGAPVSAASRAAASPARPGAPPRRVLPDATLDLRRVRSTDAVLHYQADSVMAQPGLPLRRFKLDLTLDHGVMAADPIAFGFPRGQLAGSIRIDARPDVPEDSLDLKVTNVRLEDFVTRPGAPAPIEGTLEARAKLTGRGDSVYRVASTADGEITLVAPHGQIRQSLAELLGIDVSRALGLLLSKNQSQIGLRCAVADFRADNGVLTARTLVFDTDTVRANGSGTLTMADETLNLTLKGAPKRFRLIRLDAPITVTGPLTAPKFGVKAGGAAAQVGEAVALGALLTPAAAILPFVDPGLAHDADCVGAVTSAQSMGVPVKPSATTQTNARAAAPAKRGL